jgi:hypothetical protein
MRINARFANCLLAIGLSGLAPVAVQAQAASDQWQWELGVYAWFPAIGITTSFPSGADGPSIDASSSDVLDALKMTFMGQVEARKGQWGVWTDLVYADLGGSVDGSRDFSVGGQTVEASADLDLDIKSIAWSTAGIYNLTSTPENTTDSARPRIDGGTSATASAAIGSGMCRWMATTAKAGNPTRCQKPPSPTPARWRKQSQTRSVAAASLAWNYSSRATRCTSARSGTVPTTPAWSR